MQHVRRDLLITKYRWAPSQVSHALYDLMLGALSPLMRLTILSDPKLAADNSQSTLG